jgi:hypothetical protein
VNATKHNARSIAPYPGLLKTEIGMFRTGSWLPGQFWLVECLAMDVFQEVGIDLVGDSEGGTRLGARPTCWPPYTPLAYE